MNVFEEIEFRAVNGFKEYEWGNLYLEHSEECIAHLAMGRFGIYIDIVGDASIRKGNARWDASAIRMSPELMEKIEETNKDPHTTLEERYGYVWEIEPYFQPCFLVEDDSQCDNESIGWDEPYMRSELWCKWQSIMMLRNNIERVKTRLSTPLTVKEEALLQQLHEVDGVSYELKSFKEGLDLTSKIQKVLENEEDLLNCLKHIECSAVGHVTVVWQSDSPAVNRAMHKLMKQWQ